MHKTLKIVGMVISILTNLWERLKAGTTMSFQISECARVSARLEKLSNQSIGLPSPNQ